MSSLRKSSRIRKPITTIDQNLEDENQVLIASKPNDTNRRAANMRSSIDDSDEREMLTPRKERKTKASTTATKISPYFSAKLAEKKMNSHVKDVKITKLKNQKQHEKKNVSIDKSPPNTGKQNENLMSIDSNSKLVTTINNNEESDSEEEDDDDDAWEHVQSRPNEEVAIQRVTNKRYSYLKSNPLDFLLVIKRA